MDVKDLSVNLSSSVRDSLEMLDKTGFGVLFVVNDNFVLSGIVTDGDLRRALLNGVSMDTSVKKVMNKNFLSLPIETDNVEILRNITPKIKVIPLTGENNELLDFASINKIRKISIASPLLDGNELAYVTDCIKSSWISSQGIYVRKFEQLFTEYHNGYIALAVSNGTVALHLALAALNIGPGDEVLVPNLTFAASVNAILYTGATPVLVDVNKDTWNIEVESASKYLTNKTKAIMPVHLYGHPCDMDSVMKFANENELYVIEDCAEALGSYYNGNPVGTFGDVATFSFYGNKTITTGEGGMVIFKDPEFAKAGEVLRDHGMQKKRRYWHDQVGYNYRLTNLQAAIGVAQYERLDEFVKAKRHVAFRYNEVLSQFKSIQIPAELPNCVNSYWLYTFIISDDASYTREDLMEYLGKVGIETRPVFYPMHFMPPYVSYGKDEDLKTSIRISEKGMSLPSSVNLTNDEVEYICSYLKTFLDKHEK